MSVVTWARHERCTLITGLCELNKMCVRGGRFEDVLPPDAPHSVIMERVEAVRAEMERHLREDGCQQEIDRQNALAAKYGKEPHPDPEVEAALQRLSAAGEWR